MPEAAYRVCGRVQGVGYRWWARSQAARLGLHGAVRNAADGSVEVMARGAGEDLAELRRLLGEGPPGAAVSEVREVSAWDAPTDGFHIVR